MATAIRTNLHLEPYNYLLDIKYIPYAIFLFSIFSFVSIIVLLDYMHQTKKIKNHKVGILLCFVTSVNLGLSIFFLLIYFNICL
ncbi:conserved Plasmodium protein, unknown function [Plasmodium berghei]|uniref:Dolichyl-diphosphooligosaccharide--protein glycosyltransferase subunit OST5, putative n=2 Tax=Plasmodium berghei TaxID=5821 RepID=A0A509ARB1_PLABA|nr:dolichyl-diphosphooligosaccharide--protein glycosyltransferase subunit OST5, putative [Plasmodium berghei ANKA]CXJ27575.1 conserved Plasmodium protein, unknown function [Plasmodium berghei]SCM27006.1 conserved Plasmodium protein, unknown function [Plasmodium berghei]SCN28747.1 conserved Plasmodium protein, unknown function [Plasmodium berghei]SCO63010.1 conserved Plasmodium protein, unknown function [Plasmodium berghei]SCO64494.1 conserved Plasmodium protein, unknown function [Plasmodium be|eukprot:XP_034424393.1 dolichyl-diphosphooligosaccharide--protein glycosyltransferase subunit OST5, putative [Plasmodium berghei ANKA]